MPKIVNPEDPIFYTYILLDPRIKGTFIYDDGNLVLEFLPIYGGKGYNLRCESHLKDAINTNKESDKLNIIREIVASGFEPKIFKVLENVTEKEAFTKERYVIRVVGRADKGLGPLTNKTDGGDGYTGNIIDLKGQKFGRYLVLEFKELDKWGMAKWFCRCDCGNERLVGSNDLRSGHSKSCGCLRVQNIRKANTKHGFSSHPLYNIWRNMKDGCENSNNKIYKDCGFKGIIVCDRWSDFENFYEDMGDRPSDNHRLKRLNGDGNFEPNNCRWILKKKLQI